MSLPMLSLLALVLIWTWVQLRRIGERLRRLEHVTGMWRVQASSPIELRRLTDEEFAELVDSWELGHEKDAQ